MLKKALVIDNNEVFLKLLSHTLQLRGLQVLTASDGISALKILKQYRPDIIFTDLIMPNIDGENLCRIICKKKEFSSTLLIIVSAVAVEEDVDFRSFGAHACIAKGPASEMTANIDLILSHVKNGRMDLITGKSFGAENRIQRSIAKELLEAKRHLKRILDNIDNGILEFSKSETIVNCNTYAAELFKKNATDLLSVDIRGLFSKDAYQHVAQCLDRFRTAKLPVESNHSVKVGSVDIVFKFISMADKDNSTSIMIIRDISEEKKARRKLKEYLGHLENLVAERTKSYEDANRELEKEITKREKINKEREKLIKKLEDSLAKVKQLSGFIPICASCKKIRDDKGYWKQVEEYIHDHSEAEFSHSICPDCAKKLYPDLDDDIE
jgi:PAS domain S-box-containing protein